MPTYDEKSAECLIFTFKEGLLSAVAHDLSIRVGRLSVEVADDGSRVSARFDPASLTVVSAMKDGREAPGSLGEGDRRKIERSIREEVLDVRRHPEIRFEADSIRSDGETATLTGRLHLHGRSQPLSVPARRTDGGWLAEASLDQPAFGIKPFSAMLGTLRIRPDVRVRVLVPFLARA